MTKDNNKEFEGLVTDYLNWKYKNEPVFASYLGLSSYDAYLRDFSRDAMSETIDNLHKFLHKAENISQIGLNAENKIDRALLLRDIELSLIRIESIRFWEINPQIYLDEALDGIHTLMLKSFRPQEEIAEMILKRMLQIEKIFKDGKANLHYCPPVFLEVASQTSAHGIEFINTVNKNYGQISLSMGKELDKASRKAKDAIISFKEFIDRDMTVGDEDAFAIGKENFSGLIKIGYMIDKSVDEILETGEKCFADISERLTDLACELDPTRSWYEIYKILKTENPGPSGVLNMYVEYMNKAKQFLIDNDIVTIPEGEILEVDETPSFIRPLIPVAAYVSPGPYDDVQKGVFWVTPLNERVSEEEKECAIGEHNIYTANVTAPHEAYPGHHLQLCSSNLQKSPLRKQTHSDIFVEGWGLYCEEMMKEVGYLRGIKLELAQQVDQLMRAARVIIDVRLHSLGMSIQEANQFLTDVVLVSPGTAKVEINRYTMTPTQPLSYMIGQKEILRLREDYRQMMGEDFSLKEFHNKILSCGSSPIKIIRHIMMGEDYCL